MKSFIIQDFSLKYTLECGQFFRYAVINGWYYVNSGGKLFKVRQDGDKLYYENINHGFLVNFFSLDHDYKKIIKSINKDKHIAPAIKRYYGMRIIRQDPWECLISYICSANSNIPKIKMNVELLSQYFGTPIELGNYRSYSFPKVGKLNSQAKLKECKTGFRSKYICDVNKTVKPDFFDKLVKLNTEDARSELIKLKGVGPKVANCILMFSFNRFDVFPVDVWIRRVMLNHYFKKQDPTKISNEDISAFAKKYFGKYANYANQFLFYYYRENKLK